MTARAFLFAPGAGAPSTSTWMVEWRARLAALGDVHAFDYAYMLEGRRKPDRHAQLVAAHRGALEGLRARHAGPIVLAGKSMGSRIGCHVACQTSVAALVCFGYPLVGQTGALRDEVLRQLETPILFVQGTRDALCPLDHLDSVRKQMRAENELYVVETGDHSLLATRTWLKGRAETQADVDARILGVVADFVARRA